MTDIYAERQPDYQTLYMQLKAETIRTLILIALNDKHDEIVQNAALRMATETDPNLTVRVLVGLVGALGTSAEINEWGMRPAKLGSGFLGD